MARVSKGTIYRRPESACWFIRFRVDGVTHRESTGSDDRKAALARLRRRLRGVRDGTFRATKERITFERMHEILLENYRFKRNRTDPSRHVRRLAEFFGGMRGDEITQERIAAHSRKRLERDRMTPATLRRELAILKRMLRLASEHLPRVPIVDMPRVDNARQGFFEEEQVQALLPHLPAHARNLVAFLYLTGCAPSLMDSSLRGGGHERKALARLSPDRGPEPDPGGRPTGDRHEDHRSQDGFDLPSLSDRGRGAPGPGDRRGG